MKDVRHGLGEAIGRRLSLADMAKLCGLKDPDGNGRKTYSKWEEGDGPSGPVAALLKLYNDDRLWGFKSLMPEIISERLDGEA